MLTVVLFAVAVVFSLLLTRLVMFLAEKTGLVSRPKPEVAKHFRPVALGGGVALLLLLLPVSAWLARQGLLPWRFFWILLPVGALGLADDIFELGVLPKLALECVALAPYLWLCPFGPAGCVAAFLWLMYAQNAWNYIDILDGLAGWCAVLALAFCSGLLVLAGGATGQSALAAAASGACLGFLFWNSYPARIYLGDTGSLALGTLHGVLVLEALIAGGGPGLAWPLLIAGAIPLFEITFLFVERTRRGVPFYRGAPDHYSLRMQHAGWSVPVIIVRTRLAGIGLGVLAVGAVLLRGRLWAVALSAAVLLAAVVVAWKYFRGLPIPPTGRSAAQAGGGD
ncbi:hypothetical protein LLH00_17865 [bacterium]|nr:hypothetical protein [bacterium]